MSLHKTVGAETEMNKFYEDTLTVLSIVTIPQSYLHKMREWQNAPGLWDVDVIPSAQDEIVLHSYSAGEE